MIITLYGTDCTELHQNLTLALGLLPTNSIAWQCTDATQACQAAYNAQNPSLLLSTLKHSDLNLLAQTQTPQQQWLREVLNQAEVGYCALPANPESWLGAATLAAQHLLKKWPEPERQVRWQWLCDACDDADCEQHLRLLA